MKNLRENRFCLVVLCLLGLVVPCLRLSAASIEEAERLLRSGREAEVEAALSEILEREEPSIRALELSFEAARALGNVYTAERRVRELIRRQGREKPEWIFEGAKVALDLGQTSRAMDRLMYFVRQQDDKSEELARALDLLSRESLFPAAFETYVRLYPEQATFQTGFRMMERIREAGQPGAFLEMGRQLLENFQEEWQVNRVHNEIWNAVDRKMLGLERDAAYKVMFTGKLYGFDVIYEMIRRRGIRQQELVALQKLYGKPLPYRILERFDGIDRIKNRAIRDAMAREYLEFEPIYRQSDDPETYRNYLWRIFGHPHGFIAEEGRVISEEQAERFFRRAAEMHPDRLKENLHWMGSRLLTSYRDTPLRFVQDPARRLKLLRDHHPAFRGDELKELVQESEDDSRAIRALVEMTGGRQDVRMELLSDMSGEGLGDLVARTAGYELMMNPANFDTRSLARYFINSEALPEERKVAILQRVHAETGNGGRLKELLDHRDSKLDRYELLKTFRDDLDENADPRDPVLALLYEVEEDSDLRRRDGSEPKEAFTAKIREAFEAYGERYPARGVPETRNAYMERLLSRYRDTCGRKKGKRIYAQVVGPRLSDAADWEAFFTFTIEESGEDGYATFHAARAALEAGRPYRSAFHHARHPETDAEPLLRDHYQEMSREEVKEYLAGNRNRWEPEVLAGEMLEAMKHHSLVQGSNWHSRELLESLRKRGEGESISAEALDSIADGMLELTADEGMVADWETRRELLRLYREHDKSREGTLRLIRAVDEVKDPVSQLNLLFSALTSDRDNVPGGPYEGELKAGTKPHILLERALPALREMGTSDLARLRVEDDLVEVVSWYRGRREIEDARQELFDELRIRLTWALSAGAPGDAEWNEYAWSVDDGIQLALRNDDMDRVVSLVNLAGREAKNTDRRRIEPVVEVLREAEKMELLLLLTQLVETDDPAAASVLNQARALAGAEVEGIYPVEKSAPEYPLFVAADELARHNAEQAWNLLREHLEVFEQDPLQYPQEFTGWALEKLREVKGEDNALQELSMALSDEILNREDEITPWLKARVMLNRAEIFRARQDFEAARLEYRTLRTHPDLQGTPFGRRAMFRDVDLMIAMGNTGAAEGLIEYWLSNPDPELQVKAHYFRALMAFEAGDDEATREHLEKVFDLDFTNSEARLLHGKWRLRTNYEVDNPEVLLGTLQDRTILRPGQPLRVSVQDPNLSVVGAGTAIPVILRTSEGGDEERLRLFPSTRDPKLFRGSMDTVLASASPGNQLLEVSGLDVVSYEIDPEFLAERGMTGGAPKRLRIVDDARLAVSAGRILDESEQQSIDIESQMNLGEMRSEGRMSQVRPGNPFYILVRDRDQSSGERENRVPVRVSTSSGDEIRGVMLEEIAPYTGQFRGEVSTALPPPRASASDEAEGVDLGAVINHTREGFWRSRSDGEQGKWIKADTMGSHPVKRSRIETPEASRIAQVRLYGSLMGEERVMGNFPAPKSRRGGVRLQTTKTTLRSLLEYRRYFSEIREGAETLDSFRYDVEETRRRFHLQGAFWMPEERNLRLRLMPVQEDHKHALSDVWLDILVDGEKVAGGRGKDLMDRPLHVNLSKGGHVLEAFGYARRERDAFYLAIENPDGSTTPLPEEWFRTEENPELADFLKDRATLRREDGAWTATFREPERLRSLRWEFVSFAGDSISVTEFLVEGPDGERILPTDTDFTDALDNDILEIAPGDKITVTYEDRVTTEGQRRLLTQELGSSFTNGSIDFFYEDLTQTDSGIQRNLYNAYRFRPGDDFLVVVSDADLDTGPGVDTVEITVSTRGGEELVLTASEIADPDREQGEPVHHHRFQALLRTSREASTGGNTLRVGEGDRITVQYLDEENTSPGIPAPRIQSLDSVQAGAPDITLYHTWREAVEDTGEEVRQKLEQIRKRTGNENVQPILTWTTHGMPMTEEAMSEDILVANVDTPLPLEVYLPSEAMHRGSTLTMKALTASERAAARAEGRSPRVITREVGLGRGASGVRIRPNPEREEESFSLSGPEENATFGTQLVFRLGSTDEWDDGLESDEIVVRGDDQVYVTLFDNEDELLFEQVFQLQSRGDIALMDNTYEAGRNRIHLGERFFVQVVDSDRDTTDEMDEVTVRVETSRSGNREEVTLKETMPHSGIFTGVLMPRFPREDVEESEGGDAPAAEGEENAFENSADALVGIPTIEVGFGENLTFVYADEKAPPIHEAGERTVTGSIFEGSDGDLLAFTKHFPDAEMAVRVQFRLAESLFEMAKDYRKLEQDERSANAIAEGKRILEEALTNYPNTGLAVEGEYLLANLYQEMAAERAESDPEESKTFYREALSRFSSILSGYPDSEFAAKAQFHKALCLEKLGDFSRASEEYVKMTYIFPESPLVGNASIRLAQHYYQHEQRFDTAGKIYANFYRRFPSHPKAPLALFMGAQSHMKQGEIWEEERRERGVPESQVKTERILDEYRNAVESLRDLIDKDDGTVTSSMRAQALYWAGDASLRAMDNENAYLYLKRTTFEYPETQWARRARGLLLQSEDEFKGLE